MFAWLRHNESNHISGTGNFRYCLYQIDWKRVMQLRLISYLNAIKAQMPPLTPLLHSNIIFPSILTKYFHIRLLLYVNLFTPVRGKIMEHVYQI